jgi:hypothetical protein
VPDYYWQKKKKTESLGRLRYWELVPTQVGQAA